MASHKIQKITSTYHENIQLESLNNLSNDQILCIIDYLSFLQYMYHRNESKLEIYHQKIFERINKIIKNDYNHNICVFMPFIPLTNIINETPIFLSYKTPFPTINKKQLLTQIFNSMHSHDMAELLLITKNILSYFTKSQTPIGNAGHQMHIYGLFIYLLINCPDLIMIFHHKNSIPSDCVPVINVIGKSKYIDTQQEQNEIRQYLTIPSTPHKSVLLELLDMDKQEIGQYMNDISPVVYHTIYLNLVLIDPLEQKINAENLLDTVRQSIDTLIIDMKNKLNSLVINGNVLLKRKHGRQGTGIIIYNPAMSDEMKTSVISEYFRSIISDNNDISKYINFASNLRKRTFQQRGGYIDNTHILLNDFYKSEYNSQYKNNPSAFFKQYFKIAIMNSYPILVQEIVKSLPVDRKTLQPYCDHQEVLNNSIGSLLGEIPPTNNCIGAKKHYCFTFNKECTFYSDLDKNHLCINNYLHKLRIYPKIIKLKDMWCCALSERTTIEWIPEFKNDSLNSPVFAVNDGTLCYQPSKGRIVSNNIVVDQKYKVFNDSNQQQTNKQVSDYIHWLFTYQNNEINHVDKIHNFMTQFLRGYMEFYYAKSNDPNNSNNLNINLYKDDNNPNVFGYIISIDVIFNEQNDIKLLDFNVGGNYNYSDPDIELYHIMKNINMPNELDMNQDNQFLRNDNTIDYNSGFVAPMTTFYITMKHHNVPMVEGGYYHKYLKYKQKYLKLKNK